MYACFYTKWEINNCFMMTLLHQECDAQSYVYENYISEKFLTIHH